MPCDLLGAKATMMDLLAAEEEICNTEISWDPLENNKLIKDKDEHFTLLHGLHNAKTAEELCQSIGTNVVEIRNTTSKKPLQKFMGKNLVEAIWAGVEFQNNLDEITYKSDKRMATLQGFPNINYLYGGTKRTISWENALYYHKTRTSYLNHGNFVYKNDGKKIELWLRHESYPYKYPNIKIQTNPNTKAIISTPGAISVLPVICERKDMNMNAQENHINWKTSCKRHLKVMKEKVHAANYKINQIMPEALPSNLETLTPFLYMDKLGARVNKTTNNKDNAQTDSILDAQTSWNQILEQERHSTVTQCLEQQDDRQKRFPFMAAGAVVSTVFSATKFFVRLLPILKQKITEAKGETEKQPEGVLYALKDISTNTNHTMTIYRMMNNHLNLTYILSNQNEIRDSLTTIIDYIDQVYNKITTLVYVDHYKPKHAMDFITKARFEGIIKYVRTKYNENLLDDISKTVTYIGNSGASLVIATAIPFMEPSTFTKLYRIHRMPKIIDGYQIFPTTKAEYMAVEKHDNAFTPISSTLAMSCKKDGHCSSSQSTFKSDVKSCGYSNLWVDEEICDFTRTKIRRPYFTTIENKTYFSVGKKPVNVTITCTSRIYNKPGTQRVEQIANTGMFELKDSCFAESGYQKMRPSQRNLEMPRIQYKESEFIVTQLDPKQQMDHLKADNEKYRSIDLQQGTKAIHIAQTLTIIAIVMAVIVIMVSGIYCWFQTNGYLLTILGCLCRKKKSDIETGCHPTKKPEGHIAIQLSGTQATPQNQNKNKPQRGGTNDQAKNGTQ